MKYIFLATILFLSLLVGSCDSTINRSLFELHHIFPQEFKSEFAARGIDIDKYSIALNQEEHRGVTGLHGKEGQYNKQFQEFMRKNPNFSKEQAFEFADKTLKDANGNKNLSMNLKNTRFYNYKSGQPTDFVWSSRFGILEGTKATSLIFMNGVWKSFGFETLTSEEKNILVSIAIILAIGGVIATYIQFGLFPAIIFSITQLILITLGYKVEKFGICLLLSICLSIVMSLSLIMPLWISILAVVLLILILLYYSLK